MSWSSKTSLTSAIYQFSRIQTGNALNHFVKRLNQFVRSGAAALATLIFSVPAFAANLPAGFVRLTDAAPTIQQEMLYAGPNNFLGRPVKGYLQPTCILTGKAADALAGIQAKLAKERKSLVVFDCYRPRRAVEDFVAWVKQGGAIDRKWSPTTPRADLIRKGYIGSRSAHSRGSTVDLAIIDLSPTAPSPAPACGHAAAAMLDFGAGFDCFDPISRVGYAGLDPQANRNRLLLIDLMGKAGFKSYAGEWWHFTLRREPYPKQSFDFPVE